MQIIFDGFDPRSDLPGIRVTHGDAVMIPFVFGTSSSVMNNKTGRGGCIDGRRCWRRWTFFVVVSDFCYGYPIISVINREDVSQG